MKVLLLVQHDGDDAAWVEDAVDEYTLDSWNGALPTGMQDKIDESPGDFRRLWVEIPDGCLDRLWDAPTVIGTVEIPA